LNRRAELQHELNQALERRDDALNQRYMKSIPNRESGGRTYKSNHWNAEYKYWTNRINIIRTRIREQKARWNNHEEMSILI
ncbi:unnamed protein product, partial [marine sediment metagenome]